MAIRIEHQASPAAVGMAAFATGSGRARERRRKEIMDLFEQEQDRRRRQMEQYQGFLYSKAIEDMRQKGWDRREDRRREWELENREWGAEQELAKEKRIEDRAIRGEGRAWRRQQFDDMMAQLDQIRQQSGGMFADINGQPNAFGEALRKFDDEMKKYQQDGTWTPDQMHEVMVPKLRALLGQYNAQRDVVPWDKRPGNIRIEGGRKYRKSMDPTQPDEDIGWALPSEMTPEQQRQQQEAKQRRFDIMYGVQGQWVPGPRGDTFEPLKTDTMTVDDWNRSQGQYRTFMHNEVERRLPEEYTAADYERVWKEVEAEGLYAPPSRPGSQVRPGQPMAPNAQGTPQWMQGPEQYGRMSWGSTKPPYKPGSAGQAFMSGAEEIPVPPRPPQGNVAFPGLGYDLDPGFGPPPYNGPRRTPPTDPGFGPGLPPGSPSELLENGGTASDDFQGGGTSVGGGATGQWSQTVGGNMTVTQLAIERAKAGDPRAQDFLKRQGVSW